ncbi:hypothetical protein [[Mycobacterium] burgundiense]|uniref:Mce-associated membrane protein n=1 Tax=[Mycobacterium] burgundiense TaxID=3064286 RepID=A0ABM9LKD4_9MYCO|nr:hypothetical protein [Mycolicibacterium sp. MU0053]CAJ1500496.1 hypothetical protein MU0053_001686 [Mycolicibacterium sp. MU0053]
MADSISNAAEPIKTETDPAAPAAEESGARGDVAPADPRVDEAPADVQPSRQRRSINIGVRSLVTGAVVALLLAAVATLAWLYIGAQHQLDAQASRSADSARAEKIALDYAVNAATMNYKDLKPWKVALVAGTSPELNGKLTEAATSMEQIMVPLEWASTAEPLVAKVRSNADGIYVVDCFVSVQTKTVQASEALQSTATYSVTIDSNSAWQITDVGGVGKVVGPR